MRISLNTSNPRWFDRVWAALIFFTRLPFWRIYQPPQCAYETVVEHWPLMGWLTGGVMALTFLVSSFWVSASVSVALAMVARLLLTGALHEDGLADFFDGFGGGGNDRERILAIMKDSRIGTFGVLGLIIYELLFFLLLRDFAVSHYYLVTALFIVAADCYAKLIAAQVIQVLPYARTASTAKNRVEYRQFSLGAAISIFVQGIIPMAIYLYLTAFANWEWIMFTPGVVMFFLYLMMNRKLRGYTGDCCGALFLLCELSVYLFA